MELKNYFAQTSTGTVIPGATFYVYLSGTTTLATIYDKNGVALANPSTATTQGLIQFKAVDGSYDVTVVSGANSYTIPCACFDGNAAFRECLRRSYAEAGYTLVDGTFGTGATLQSQTDALLNERDGKAYSWVGTYPSGGYVVAAGTDPTINASFVSVADYISKIFISVSEFGAKPDYDRASRTIVSNSTNAFKAALNEAYKTGGVVYIPAAPTGKAYYINESLWLRPETHHAGQYGAFLLGENTNGSCIVFDVAEDDRCIILVGTGGIPSNVGYANLTLRPHIDGNGVAIYENGLVSIRAYEVDASFFKVGLHISNAATSGIYTEFGTHTRFWLKNNATNILVTKDGGDLSFHGLHFDQVVLNNESGQTGLKIGAGCVCYNVKWHMTFFGNTGAVFIRNDGEVSGRADMFFEAWGTIPTLDNRGAWLTRGAFDLKSETGVFSDVSTSPICAGSYITPSALSKASWSYIGSPKVSAPTQLNNAYPFGGIFGFSGSDQYGSAFIGYSGGQYNKQGIAMCTAAYGEKATDAALLSLWHMSGFTSFLNSFTFSHHTGGDMLTLNSSGYHTGKIGRYGSISVPANAGVQQNVGITVSVPAAAQSLFINLRLNGPATDVVFLLAVAQNPRGGNSNAVVIGKLLDLPGAGFTAPSAFSINSSGLLSFTMTTSETIIVSANVVGVGIY